MSLTRRDFIKGTLATGIMAHSAGLPALGAEEAGSGAGRSLRILILGGTGFLGPHTVNAALGRGHEITLFNRGKTNPHLFPQLEKLKGDRTKDLSPLAGREWDAVIDTSGYVPRVVSMSARLLADAVQQYVFISSISVYRDFSRPGMDETTPVGTLEDETVEAITNETYGPLKALSEQAAEQAMPGRVTTIRPGLIVGPRDRSDRFTYWPVRVARGGEVLAPGTPGHFVQFIDVRDLGAWIVLCIESGTTGTFNADKPPAAYTMGKLLSTCRDVTGSDASFTWVDADFLDSQDVAPWSDMPVWLPATGENAGFGRIATARAAAAGLTHRPPAVTIRDTLEWFETLPDERRSQLRAGIGPEREQEVLAAWHTAKSESAP